MNIESAKTAQKYLTTIEALSKINGQIKRTGLVPKFVLPVETIDLNTLIDSDNRKTLCDAISVAFDNAIAQYESRIEEL